MYLVLEGQVSLRMDGNPVGNVSEGDVCGEMALVDRSASSTLAEAVGDVRVLPLSRSRFESLLIQHPEFARTVLRTMTLRLRQVNLKAGGAGRAAKVNGS